MARAAFADDDELDDRLDDLEDEIEDEGDEDLDDDDVDEEAQQFYEEFARPMTPEDSVELLAAAAVNQGSWYRGGLITVPAPGAMVCRGCGCSDTVACSGGCFWVAPNLCSRCAR